MTFLKKLFVASMISTSFAIVCSDAEKPLGEQDQQIVISETNSESTLAGSSIESNSSVTVDEFDLLTEGFEHLPEEVFRQPPPTKIGIIGRKIGVFFLFRYLAIRAFCVSTWRNAKWLVGAA